jgi:gliding motility-associated lipoprotein GldD
MARHRKRDKSKKLYVFNNQKFSPQKFLPGIIPQTIPRIIPQTIRQTRLRSFLLLSFMAASIFSCNSVYTPKPKGYFKIDFPDHQYRSFDQPGYPYTFEYPVYANIVRDSSFFEASPENPYWINIDFPRFNARIYVSYKAIGPPAGKSSPYPKATGNSFDKLRDDAYKMTMKHSYKATSIEDSVIRTPGGISGIFFNVGGNAATAKQFFLTDSVRHFLRGALYFDAPPNEDSVGIVNRFLQEDMLHLINTFHWRTTPAAASR